MFANKETEGPRQPKENLQKQSTVKSEAADVNDNLSALRTTRKEKGLGILQITTIMKNLVLRYHHISFTILLVQINF